MRETWRSHLLHNELEKIEHYFTKQQIQNLGIYQFGVFGGDSMREIKYIFKRNNIHINKFYGFDVFTGMPKETNEPIFQNSWNPDIEPDAFNVLKKLNVSTINECVKNIKKTLIDLNIQFETNTEHEIYAGLVQETIHIANKDNKLQPALYIDFDMDIYSPTKYVFEYMLKNKLILEGTLIGYDDWGGTPNFTTFGDGESRAHKEIIEQYGIQLFLCSQIGNEFPNVHNIWRVEKL
jgi:hypothetical protein